MPILFEIRPIAILALHVAALVDSTPLKLASRSSCLKIVVLPDANVKDTAKVNDFACGMALSFDLGAFATEFFVPAIFRSARPQTIPFLLESSTALRIGSPRGFELPSPRRSPGWLPGARRCLAEALPGA